MTSHSQDSEESVNETNSLRDMARLVAAGRVSPLDLVDAHLLRIERINPRINAFVRIESGAARTTALLAAEAIRRGDPVGPLHGVPVTVKDSFDVEGLPTLCGSRFRLAHRAAEDSTAVRRLREAGAIILGKTNCPEFLANYETENHITGRTVNPWNLDRTAGGSSGGEAAAIAAHCSAGGIGSDGGGSVRVPAHCCGIAGLKPTPGRVPATGHFPAIGHPGGLLGVAGPMARSAADVQLLFEVLCGYDAQDPFSAPVPLKPDPGLPQRVGLMERFYGVPVQPAVRETLLAAAKKLEEIGIRVEPFTPSGLERAPNVWWFFFGRLPAETTRRMIEGKEADAHWTGTEFLHRALQEAAPTGQDVLENLAIRDRMRASLLRQMERVPVLLLPACGVSAWRPGERRWETPEKSIGLFEAMMPVTPFNLLGFPGLVIPFGFDADGLPVGVQLVGRPYEEELLLETGVRLEEARGQFPSPSFA